MTTGYVWHERYGWHDTGNAAGFIPAGGIVQPYQHFESAESKTRMASLVEGSGLLKSLVRLQVNEAKEEDILRVHSRQYLERIKLESRSPRGGDAGDGQSPFGQGAYEIALLAAGGTMAALGATLRGEVKNAYALVRPPGHHARATTGMGFCIFSNLAIAIQWARKIHGLGRVAVVDWDVHHGNGTEEIFYSDKSTLTISLHQDNLFPRGSGLITDRGEGDGRGYAVNVPLPAGSGNGAYLKAVDRIVAPALRAFKPDIILVASGFDASANDPLGRMLVTAGGYRAMTTSLMGLAEELCEGRLVMSHEGGYSPVYVPFCGLAVLQALSGVDLGFDDPFEEIWASLPDQGLTAGQDAVIRQAEELASALKTSEST
jgi:acetoin utilization deacetylase AcuC-like enzyme